MSNLGHIGHAVKVGDVRKDRRGDRVLLDQAVRDECIDQLAKLGLLVGERAVGLERSHSCDCRVGLIEEQVHARIGHCVQREVFRELGLGPQLPEAMHKFGQPRWRSGFGVGDAENRFLNAILHWFVHAIGLPQNPSRIDRPSTSVYDGVKSHP